MRTSFCVTCRNRSADLKQTLLVNLLRLVAGEQLVLLDYNSSDGVFEWARGFAINLKDIPLVVYREITASRFFRCHAKNLAHLLAIYNHAADVVVNLDADNYLTPVYLQRLREWRSRAGERAALAPQPHCHGCRGRFAATRKAFLALTGYDEAMTFGYGYEELDIEERAKRSGVRLHRVNISGYDCIETAPEQRAATQADNLSIVLSNKLHRDISRKNIQNGCFAPNAGKQWGAGAVVDHNGRCITVSSKGLK